MSGVRYLASSAATNLVVAAQELQSAGARLKVRASLPVQQSLGRLGAEKWLDIEVCPKPNLKPAGEAEAAHRPAGAPGAVAHARAGEAEAGLDSGEMRKASVGLNVPGTTTVRSAAPGAASSDPLVAEAGSRAGTLLMAEEEDVPPQWAPLKRLVIMQTYTFQVIGARSEVTGRVLCRIGGPWIVVDVHGARKMVNIEQVGVIDLLA
jgi:hypothetical protein